MPKHDHEVYAICETKLKDKGVSLAIGSEMKRLAVGDIIFHDKSSEEDRATMKAFLMQHPKAVNSRLNKESSVIWKISQ